MTKKRCLPRAQKAGGRRSFVGLCCSLFSGQKTLTLEAVRAQRLGADGQTWIAGVIDGRPTVFNVLSGETKPLPGCFEQGGQATRAWPNGKTYTGQWNGVNQRHGHGTNTWPDGRRHVGRYRNGKRHGDGIFTWPNGRVYVGHFVDGARSGEGTMTWPDGRAYVGRWHNSTRSGMGTMSFPNGNKYVGMWHNGKRARSPRRGLPEEAAPTPAPTVRSPAALTAQKPARIATVLLLRPGLPSRRTPTKLRLHHGQRRHSACAA